MSITEKELEQIALLARLDCSDDMNLSSDIKRILGFVEQLQSADTANIEPLSNPLEMIQRLRPDSADGHCDRDRFQIGAPHVESGLYLVPRVVE